MRTPHEHNLGLMKEAEPAFRYRGEEDFGAWSSRANAELERLLGLPFKKCDADFEVEYTAECDGFTETRFTFQSEEGYRVPAHLWVPFGAKGPLPVAVCLQGHSKGMHISLGRPKYAGDEESIKGDRDFAVRALREGYCALSIEQRCFGECGGAEKGPDCYQSSMTALLMGRTTIGERVWDVRRVLDVVEKHFPQADMGRVVCMGNSGGGTTAFFSACIEPRISYAMVSCYFCTFEDSVAAMHHCSCNIVPGLRAAFDMGDLAGLIAPRPLVVVAGREDPIFPVDGVQKAFEEAKRYYAAAGASNRIALALGEAGHRFYADIGWKAMNAFVFG